MNVRKIENGKEDDCLCKRHKHKGKKHGKHVQDTNEQRPDSARGDVTMPVLWERPGRLLVQPRKGGLGQTKLHATALLFFCM